MRRILFALALFAAPLAAHAQENLEWATPWTPPAADPGPQEPAFVIPDNPAFVPVLPDDPTPVPVDGGLVFLAAAGAGLAAKRLRERRRTQRGEPTAL